SHRIRVHTTAGPETNPTILYLRRPWLRPLLHHGDHGSGRQDRNSSYSVADPDSLRRLHVLVDVLGIRLVLAYLEERGSQVPAGAQRMDPDRPPVRLVHAGHLLRNALPLDPIERCDLLRNIRWRHLPVLQTSASGISDRRVACPCVSDSLTN